MRNEGKVRCLQKDGQGPVFWGLWAMAWLQVLLYEPNIFAL